jgi:hypothetical protein
MCCLNDVRTEARDQVKELLYAIAVEGRLILNGNDIVLIDMLEPGTELQLPLQYVFEL